LFKNDIFTVSCVLSLLTGGVMFGAMIFIPEYQQLVRGYSATKSGLMMLPLVGGLLVSMITSGRWISTHGRYRWFPIVGTAITTVGLWLFSHISIGTSQLQLSAWMAVLGIGLGLYMQVLTLAVQNSIERTDMGAATSVVTFFRSMGASFGTAIFGAILTSRLTHYLTTYLPPQAAGHVNTGALQQSTAVLAQLPASIVSDVLRAFASAFHDVFLWTLPFAALTFVISFFLREQHLRGSVEQEAAGIGLE